MKPTSIALLVLSVLVACDHGRSDAVGAAKPNASVLVTETRDLWLEYRDRLGIDVPPSKCPASVAALNPNRVYVSRHGLYIETYKRFVESAGIFIRHDLSYVPPRAGDPGFEEVAPGVYWYFAPG